MHYKNGREAKTGDPVLFLDYNRNLITGVIHSLATGSDSCNCNVAQIIPGGVVQRGCETVNKMYHAEDALLAIEPLALAPVAPITNP